jgi:hypothetical protein
VWPGVCSTSRRQAPDRERIAVDEQPIELRPVALELGAFVEHLAKGVLHHRDLRADPDLAPQRLLQVGRGRQVVGMHMGFQHPFHAQPPVTHERDDRIRRPPVGPAGNSRE